jgi:DNA-binding CsgD family transcriptional regulator/N-acetylneuraminic acid mutarotase
VSDNETAIPLSKRELQVLEMVATGASNQQIAHQLVISINTVKVHLRNIFEKLEVQSRTEAVLRGIQEGWITTADDNGTPPEEASAPPKTYLLSPQPPTTLTVGQHLYLSIAVLLAAVVAVLPLIPKAPARVKPNLPVIYAQAPTPVPAENSSNDWATQAPMPTKRAGLGLVAFEGRIFAIGGVRANNQATRLVEIYDPGTDSWSEGAAKPTAAANIAGAVLEDKIYIPGGCTNEGEALASLEIYDPQTDKWSKDEALPAGRCGYGLVAHNDKLYLFGGWNGKAFEDTVFIFSPGKKPGWEVLDTPMPRAKGYVGAAVLNDDIYVIGGYDGDNEFYDAHIFLPDRGEWVEKSPLQEKRGGLGVISVANNLYAVGGGWNQTLTTSERYDPQTDTWTTFEAPFSHQWRNMGMASIDTEIYAMGGWDGTEQRFIDSVVSYQFLFQLFLPISNFGE